MIFQQISLDLCFNFITGLSTYTGDCDPGFYCPGGDSVPNPVVTPCPIGLHCPMGSGLPVPCEPGSYTNLTQQSECLICPAGFYCVPEEVIQGMFVISISHLPCFSLILPQLLS